MLDSRIGRAERRFSSGTPAPSLGHVSASGKPCAPVPAGQAHEFVGIGMVIP